MNYRLLLVVSLAGLGYAVVASSVQLPRSQLEEIPGGATGYRHGTDRSRFVLGPEIHVVDEDGFTKVIGDNGTFAVSALNGSVIATQDATSPILAQRPFGSDLEVHNKRVLEYFVGVGIPRDQITGVHGSVLVAGSGRTDDTISALSTQTIAYYSILERSAAGISIVDSVAWARLTEGEQVVGEAVFWPAIPATIVLEARRFQEQLAMSSTRAAYLDKLPTRMKAGDVVIRHTTAAYPGPFEAIVSFDVHETLERGGGFTRHFGIRGEELRLPEEQLRQPNYIRPLFTKPPPPQATDKNPIP